MGHKGFDLACHGQSIIKNQVQLMKDNTIPSISINNKLRPIAELGAKGPIHGQWVCSSWSLAPWQAPRTRKQARPLQILKSGWPEGLESLEWRIYHTMGFDSILNPNFEVWTLVVLNWNEKHFELHWISFNLHQEQWEKMISNYYKVSFILIKNKKEIVSNLLWDYEGEE